MASNEAPRPTSASETRNLLTTILGFFSLAWLGLALVIAGGMFLVTPTYFRPMFSSPAGWLMILVAAVLIAGGVLLTLLAMRWMKRGGGYLAAGIVVIVVVFFVQFITLWIVLLGPALLILSESS